MIVNAFPWMSLVMQSFARIGSAATGLPNLNPSAVLKVGGTMAEMLFDTPVSGSVIPNVELMIVEAVSAFFVLLSFVVAAAALLLTLVESYLVIGGAALLLGFGGSRWTAPITEGYFGYVIRVGTRLLFFYLVLGIGVQLATQWQTALTAACNPVATTLPWYSTYGAPPKMVITTACSNAIPVRTMLDLAALSIVFLIVTLAVPYTAAGIVSGTVGLALTHAFEAAYLAKTITRPVVSALQSIGSQATDSFNRARRGGLDARLAYGRDSTPISQPGSAAIAPVAPVQRHSPLATTLVRNGQTKAAARPTTRI
jgi:type IV secretory pathway TrbL component